MPDNKKPLSAATEEGQNEPRGGSTGETTTHNCELQVLDFADHCRDIGREFTGYRINWAEVGL